MINFAIYFLEFVSVLLIIHLVFQSRFRMDFSVLILFFVSMFVLFLAYYTQIQLITYITQFAFYIYALYEFRRSWWETLLRFAFSIAIIAILETVFRGQFLPWFQTNDPPLWVYVCINVCMLIFTGILYSFFVYKHMYLKFDVSDKTFIILVLIINLFVLYIKDGEHGKIFRLVMYVVSCFLIFIRFATITKRGKMRQKIEDEKWLSQYTEQYEKLIQEVRKRQHDYKNEIQTIKSACATISGSVAMEMIKEYEDSDQYTNILNGCEHPIVAGLVYSKLREFEEQGITTLCQIHMRNIGLTLKTRDVIDIIGILLDNAFECANEQEDKTIQLNIEERREHVSIRTSNPSPYISQNEISKMFTLGYSTKGKKRGIGLHTVQELVKKCHGDIITGNQTVDNKNYFSIQVVIPLQKT